jgi:hypothetical protein
MATCNAANVVLTVTVIALAILLRMAQNGWKRALKIAEEEMARSARYVEEMRERGIW